MWCAGSEEGLQKEHFPKRKCCWDFNWVLIVGSWIWQNRNCCSPEQENFQQSGMNTNLTRIGTRGNTKLANENSTYRLLFQGILFLLPWLSNSEGPKVNWVLLELQFSYIMSYFFNRLNWNTWSPIFTFPRKQLRVIKNPCYIIVFIREKSEGIQKHYNKGHMSKCVINQIIQWDIIYY